MVHFGEFAFGDQKVDRIIVEFEEGHSDIAIGNEVAVGQFVRPVAREAIEKESAIVGPVGEDRAKPEWPGPARPGKPLPDQAVAEIAVNLGIHGPRKGFP